MDTQRTAAFGGSHRSMRGGQVRRLDPLINLHLVIEEEVLSAFLAAAARDGRTIVWAGTEEWLCRGPN